MVGNAVSVPVASWIGRGLASPRDMADVDRRTLAAGERWTAAAASIGGVREAWALSERPLASPRRLDAGCTHRQVRRRTVVLWSVERLLHAAAGEHASRARRLPELHSPSTSDWRRRMTSAPIGTFRAHSTRDGEALARDGQPYFAINRLSGDGPSQPGIETCSRFSSRTGSGCSHGSMISCRSSRSRRGWSLDLRRLRHQSGPSPGQRRPGYAARCRATAVRTPSQSWPSGAFVHAAGLATESTPVRSRISTGAPTWCSPAREGRRVHRRVLLARMPGAPHGGEVQ